MDPNETLTRIRALSTRIQECGDFELVSDYADQLATHVDALDAWLSRGGFLPAPWTR